jgi:hypothetical protein
VILRLLSERVVAFLFAETLAQCKSIGYSLAIPNNEGGTMQLKENMKLESINSGFIVMLGEPIMIGGITYYPVVYDDFSSGIETEAMICKYYKGIE